MSNTDVGATYAHYKQGHKYRVLLNSIMEHNQKPVVSYQRLDDQGWPTGPVISRYEDRFHALVKNEQGRAVRRFEKV
jgi:hypothetical protein